jgi:heme/copper-type cytochrome/quinol oxidase subunit 4
LNFYIGVVFSFLAVVLTEKLPSFRSPLLAMAGVGAGLAIVCLLRFLRSNDEREQQINYRALTFAFTGTLVFSALVGFLQMFGFHSVPWLGIPVLMISLWSFGLIRYSWRYR